MRDRVCDLLVTSQLCTQHVYFDLTTPDDAINNTNMIMKQNCVCITITICVMSVFAEREIMRGQRIE